VSPITRCERRDVLVVGLLRLVPVNKRAILVSQNKEFPPFTTAPPVSEWIERQDSKKN
jgi:hypothetical protein